MFIVQNDKINILRILRILTVQFRLERDLASPNSILILRLRLDTWTPYAETGKN